MNLFLSMKHPLFLSLGFAFSLLVGGQIAYAQQVDASLQLNPSVMEAEVGDEFEVEILLNNPGLQNVVSVRTWLEYDPAVLEGVSIDTQGSVFGLSAPGENEFGTEEGLVKIGRSNISGGFSESQTLIATVKFKVLKDSNRPALVSAYNYQDSKLGHTSVNIIDQGFPVNILGSEPAFASILIGGAIPSVVVDETVSLPRPQNLKINTGSGYVDLKWDLGSEPELKGYYLYYGKTSGQYTRRRTLDAVNSYRLDELNNGEAYYFALTAYDAEGNESDYSDEVAIIVNEPLSSTSPFDDLSGLMLASIPETPKNGPFVWWLAFSALGLGGALVFGKKRA